MDITLKIYNPASGKEEAQDFYINPKGRNPELEEMGIKIKRSDLNTDDEGISKLEKKYQLKQNKWNKETRREDRADILSPEKQDLVKRILPPEDDEPSANTATANTAQPTISPDTTPDDKS